MRTSLLRPALLSLLGAAAIACGATPEGKSGGAQNLTQLDPELEAAAVANLARVAREIDVSHLKNYGKVQKPVDPATEEALARKFLESVLLEYEAEPELLNKRVQTLASMVFFSAPEVSTDPEIGHVTPFHGMDDAAFEALMANEDFVFASHMEANGSSPNGVRPFSVCETKFLIELSKGEVGDPAYVSDRRLTNYEGYATAYGARAASCEQRDLDEWYNFRGLGALRPSWLESNYNDRILRQMLKTCKSSTGAKTEACKEFKSDRLAYRDRKNIGLALREMVFDTRAESTIEGVQDGDYMADPDRPGVFVEDRNGDGVAEWIPSGPAGLVPGASVKLETGWVTVADDGKNLVKDDGSTLEIATARIDIARTGQFTGEIRLQLTLQDGSSVTTKVSAAAVRPLDRVDPSWRGELAGRADLGLMELFADGSGCQASTAHPSTCPLVRRFYSMIDRHENFYQTYSSTEPKSSFISSQPSPLVACSITLAASHVWDRAGTPAGGSAGFIYLMRIPFEQILVGDLRSIDTLSRLPGGKGPRVLTLQSLYEQSLELDMSKVWLDIATLSNNKYATEHEVSKFGTVPAEQIEGILVVRRPAAMSGGT